MAEQREPRRYVGGACAQPGNGLFMPDVRGIGGDGGDQGPPQRRLPVQVGTEIAHSAVQPIDKQVRTLPGVRREQPGEPARHRVAPAAPEFGLFAGGKVAQMRRQRAAPGLGEAGVDRLQQRPCHRVRRPRIVIDRAGDRGDQRARTPEQHAGAHAVVTVRPAPERVRKPLAQPAFYAAGRHQDQLLGERVRRQLGQKRSQSIGKQVGPLGTVQVKRHRGSP